MQYANVDQEEGFPEVAVAFKLIASVEKHREERYKKLADNIAIGAVFKKDEKVLWKCGNCGYVHEGAGHWLNVLHVVHPQAYFVVFLADMI